MLDLEQITKVISCGNLLTYSFVTACGVALRFRERDTQATMRASGELWVWAYLVISFLTALSIMKEWPEYSVYALSALTLIVLVKLCFVPQNNKPRRGHYTMPLVPILPAFGIFFNFMLACSLDGLTWSYFGIFLACGVLIYFSYGMWHSHLEPDNVTRGQFEVSLVQDTSLVAESRRREDSLMT